MEATRVVIDPSTMQKTALTPKRRRELRRERVLTYIRSKPYGRRLKAKEIMQFGFTSNGGATTYLKNLVRDGYITKHELGLRSAFYTVNEPVRTTKLPTFYGEGIIEEVAKVVEEQEDGRYRGARKPKRSLEEQAMRFAWEHPLYNNDLREFIKWVSKEGNDGRN